MLEVKNIAFNYPYDKNIFEDVSFIINDNECLKLDGTNGSGKTTLLNCISRFKNINTGDILFDDKSIIKKEPHQLYKLGIRRLFQDRLVFDNMSVKDQISLVGKKDEINNLLKEVPQIENLLNRNAMILSGGEKMLIALSMSFVNPGKLLILDEPFNNLSIENVELVINILNKIRNKNVSLLLVDHDNYYKADKVYKLKKNNK